ncbi:hypothetical protein MMPV_005264 [Pyropia vietnamensis]
MRLRVAVVPLLLLLAATGGHAAMLTRPPASAPAGHGRVTLPLPPARLVGAPAEASATPAGRNRSRGRGVKVRGLPPPLTPSAAAGTAFSRLTTAAHVIRGTPVDTPDAYSFVVDLSTSPTAVSSTRFCGGSLIAPDIVLTAGHCVMAVLAGVMGDDATAADGGNWSAGDVGGGEGLSRGGAALRKGDDDGRLPDGDDAASTSADVHIYAVIGRNQLIDEGDARETTDWEEGGPSVEPPASASNAATEAGVPSSSPPRGTSVPSPPIRVLAAVVHPAYTGLGSPGDVAVLLLERPSAARPVALAAASPATGTIATVVGFGVKALGTLEGVGVNVAVLPRRLQATTLTIAERSFCEPPGVDASGGGRGGGIKAAATAADGRGDSDGSGGNGGSSSDGGGDGEDGDGDAMTGRLPPGVLCTKPVVAGASACSGDSGSALVAPAAMPPVAAGAAGAKEAGRGSGGHVDVLVGVVSFGDAACAARDAGVFTDVAAVRGWVEEGVAELQAAAAMAAVHGGPPRL